MKTKILQTLQIIVVLLILIVCSSLVFALEEGETEFFEYDDEDFAITIVNVHSNGEVDAILTKPIPDYAKSLNIGESQKYLSNWQCFVVSLLDMDFSKSDMIVSSCADFNNEAVEDDPGEVIEDEPEEVIETEDELVQEEDEIIIEDVETDPEPITEEPKEGFLEKKVSIGSIMLIALVMLILIVIILMGVLVYLNRD